MSDKIEYTYCNVCERELKGAERKYGCKIHHANMTQEELADELLISQNKSMECSICELQISYCNQNDEERMEQHFKEAHGYNDEEET